MNSKLFALLQRVGRALMLPMAVLPVAGLLLRFGQPDVLGIPMIAHAGGTLFESLPLLFAIGVAVGFAHENNGVAGLAGAIGYLVLNAVMKASNPHLDMGVLAGILVGLVAGGLYNRYRDIKVPEYLAFFGGKRFVPIASALVCLVAGLALAWLWAPVQLGILLASHWLTTLGAGGAFVFGVMNTLLRLTGLHHIVNSLVWFVYGNYTAADGATVAGDLNRYFAGDKTAGAYMTGFFPVFMFGLPAACLAMYHAAPKARRARVAGALVSMALTTFLTGVTEPVEFTFLFLAPALYGIHAVLTGLAMALCQLLGIHLGFTFSAGLIDFLLSYGLSTRGWWLLPLGVVYAVLYYVLFRVFIERYNLATPGREPQDEVAAAVVEALTPGPRTHPLEPATSPLPVSRASQYLAALGGAKNLTLIDACTTRLRLEVVSNAVIHEAPLKALGVLGVVKRGDTAIQVVIGPEADLIAGEIRALINATPHP